MTKFFNKFNHFPSFWDKFFSPKYPALSCTTLYGFIAPCQNLGKTNDTIPRKRLDRRMDKRMEEQKDRQKDRQTLFYRTHLATAGHQTKGKWCE